MHSDQAQAALDGALSSGAAEYEISKSRKALLLKVMNGHPLIPLMDRFFDISDLHFAPGVHKDPGNAVSALSIGKYAVVPKVQRKEINGYHVYELTYVLRTQ
jgi:hypothetical protein